jgi:exportin-2 (importin alpha re-exporter)
LASAQKVPGFAVVITDLIFNQNISPSTRLAASIMLKNFVKSKWDTDQIAESDRQHIKKTALNLMLASPSNIQAQLCEMISLICENDSYPKWMDLLVELVNKLQTNDFYLIRNLLETAHSIFKKYRNQSKTEEIETELINVLNVFAKPMLALFNAFYQTLNSQHAQNEKAIKIIFECINLLLEIFYSLNWVDLPEFFEDHMTEYFNMFYDIMNYSNHYVETESEDTEPGLLDNTKTLIIEIANLYLEKYSEEFGKEVNRFTNIVYRLLCKTTLSVKYDQFVAKALSFLTTVSKSDKRDFFNNNEVMLSICENIIIVNVNLRDEDVELFESDPVEYIRKDIEGSDSDTRRRAASELIKGLCTHFEQKVTEIFVRKINELLGKVSAQNWKPLDVAIYLVSAVSIKGQTRGKGATQLNPLIPINEFLTSQIYPQLSSREVDALPIIKADSLKFICLFRQHLQKEHFQKLFPLIVNLLTSRHRVVHTYAAWCIERVLTVKDTYMENNIEKSRTRFVKEDVQPYTEQLLTNLFGALQFETSTENEYVMRAIMRVTSVLKDGMTKYMGAYIDSLTKVLARVCPNPKNPVFNHYIFESYATVIKFNPQFVEEFENVLFQNFMLILQRDIEEFIPYVFQIISQLLDLRSPPIPQRYMQLLPTLLNSRLWENEGNIPGLVRLLTGFFAKDKTEIVKPNNMEIVVNIIRLLIYQRKQDHNGFAILDVILMHVPLDVVSNYLPRIFSVLFTRLDQKKTTKYVRCLILFLSLFVIRHGAATLIRVIEAMKSGLFSQVFSVWITDLNRVTGNIERKTCSVALTNLLFDSKFLQYPTARDMFGSALAANIKLLESKSEEYRIPQEFIVETEPEDVFQDESGMSGYTVAFSKLSFASKRMEDPVSNIPDARVYLAKNLHNQLVSADPLIKQFITQSIANQNLENILNEYFKIVGLNR